MAHAQTPPDAPRAAQPSQAAAALVSPESETPRERTILTDRAIRRALMRIARQEIVHLSPGARARFNRRYREAFLARVEALLQEGIRRGELRPAPLSWLARGLLGMLYPFLYREDGGDDPEALADFLTDLFLEGARPPGVGRR